MTGGSWGVFSSVISQTTKLLFFIVTVVTALIAVGQSQANDVLYCMPQGSVAYRACDGTWGTSIQLVEGQPLTDPTYAGTTPASAITIYDEVLPAVGGLVVIAYHYSLSCDPPPPGYISTGADWEGVYPIYGVRMGPPVTSGGGTTGSTSATTPKAPPKKPKLKKPAKPRH